MPKFIYKTAKKTNIGQIFFVLNYGYHAHMSFKKVIDPYYYLKIADKLVAKL